MKTIKFLIPLAGLLLSTQASAACNSNSIAIRTLPTTIFSNGSYCLKSNYLSLKNTSKPMITIAGTATNVALDLNGQTITAGKYEQTKTPWDVVGVSVQPSASAAITIQNGQLLGFNKAIVASAPAASNTSLTVHDLAISVRSAGYAASGISVNGFHDFDAENIAIDFEASHAVPESNSPQIYGIASGGDYTNTVNINGVSIDMSLLTDIGSEYGVTYIGSGISLGAPGNASVANVNILGSTTTGDVGGIRVFNSDTAPSYTVIDNTTGSNLPYGIYFGTWGSGKYSNNSYSVRGACYYVDPLSQVVDGGNNYCNQ